MSKPGRSKSGAQPAVEQRRSVVLKRTFDPPVVKTQVVAGGAVTIPVTQVNSIPVSGVFFLGPKPRC